MKSFDALQPQPLRRDLPPFRPGDTVRIHVKIQEGEKERIQVFEGLVIRRRGGGASERPSPCARSPTAWASSASS